MEIEPEVLRVYLLTALARAVRGRYALELNGRFEIEDAALALANPPDPDAWKHPDDVRGEGEGVWYLFRKSSDLHTLSADQLWFGGGKIVASGSGGLDLYDGCQPAKFSPEIEKVMQLAENRPWMV